MTEPAATPTTKQPPFTHADLHSLIQYHRDALFSSQYLMSPSVIYLLNQTVKALEHYRDLLDLIDHREPDPDPFLTPIGTTDLSEPIEEHQP